jgi:hypothetical protein
MNQTVNLRETFMDAVGPELAARTDWERRLTRSSLSSFGSADGSFGDVVSVTMNGTFDSMGFTTLLWSYGMLLNDKKTPGEVVSKLLKPLTAAFVRALENTPLEQQEKGDLVNFMDSFNKARASGRFDAEGVAEISQVMRAMAKNFSAKIDAERDEKTLADTLTDIADGIRQNITVRPMKLKKA